MYIHTTEAAALLEISPRRLRQLLQKGRVKGAYKAGQYWIIPLYQGMPQIKKATRGQAGTWKTTTKPQKTTININSHAIKRNSKKESGEREPVIAVKGKTKHYAYQLEIPVPCRIVYQPDKPLDCGAKVWIEILDFDLLDLIAS